MFFIVFHIKDELSSDKPQWKEPKLTTLINEVSGGTNIQSRQAHGFLYMIIEDSGLAWVPESPLLPP